MTKYGILYKPRTAIKAQTLIDFVVECTVFKEEFDEADAGRKVKRQKKENEIIKESKWILFVDGSSTETGTIAGVYLEGPNKFSVEYAYSLNFSASNYGLEYEPLILGMKVAKEL